MNKINLWMDCDPGIDDAVALAMTAASRGVLDLKGISVVAGNQTLEKVLDNGLKLADFLGLQDVPVVPGASRPLIKENEPQDDVHGPSGLGYCVLPETSLQPAAENCILYLYQTLMALPEGEKMTIAATGPMTNLALLLKTFPEVKPRIEQIVSMGGSSVGGNMNPFGEFNVYMDPEAAQIVYSSGIPVVIAGLDVTLRCSLSRDQVKALRASEKPAEKAAGDMLQFYLDSPGQKDLDAVHIHDAATILYLTNPELFSGEYHTAGADTREGISRGMSIYTDPEEGKTPALVLKQVDSDAFAKILLEKLASL